MSKYSRSTLTTLSKRMQLIAKTYFASRKRTQLEERLFDSNDKHEKNKYDTYTERVENAYKKLDSLERLFINNEFFYQEYAFWWIERFSKNTYYRYKKKAIIHFLVLFYEEE